MKWLQRGIILIVVAGISLLLFTPFCHALFRCGCEAVWAAGKAHCNVHTAGVAHCPFCATGIWGKILPRALIILSQALVIFLPTKVSAIRRFAFGLLVFPIVGIAIGFIFRWWTHYPSFLSF